jgi:hypothetical protein
MYVNGKMIPLETISVLGGGHRRMMEEVNSIKYDIFEIL